MTWNEILDDPKIKDIIASAEEAQKQTQKNEVLNVFKLTSDYYYRENYHSDIIKEFLDPHGSHKEGNLYLEHFIKMLNAQQCSINENFYKEAIVNREKHRIDILIEGADGNGLRHFIIIENKINDAVDMYRQIPHYVEAIENGKKGIVDAVVYIPKNPYKSPDKTDWSDEEKKGISDILHIIPARLTGKTNLVDNWIMPCANASKQLDSISILRQYASLIKSLTPQVMTDNNTEDLIDYIANGKVEDILTLRQMIDAVPEQMAKALIREFTKQDTLAEAPKCFSDIHSWQPNSCVLEIEESIHQSLQIYIYTKLAKEGAYKLSIRDYKDVNQNFAWLSKTSYKFSQEPPKDGAICSCTFTFNEKNAVVRCVKEIIKAIPKQP